MCLLRWPPSQLAATKPLLSTAHGCRSDWLNLSSSDAALGQLLIHNLHVLAPSQDHLTPRCTAGRVLTTALHAVCANPQVQDGAAFVALLLDLLAQDMLPTIAFNFERSTCEYLVEEAVRYLQVRGGT